MAKSGQKQEDLTSDVKVEESTPLCSICVDDNNAKAVKFCTSCCLLYCQACLASYHPEKGAMKRHHLISSGEYASQATSQGRVNRDDQSRQQPPCTRHDLPLGMYCVTCRVVICMGCVVDHPEHSKRDISSAAEKVKSSVLNKTRELELIFQQTKESLSGFMRLDNTIQEKQDLHNKEVEKAYNAVLKDLDGWRLSSLGDIKSRYSRWSVQCSNIIKGLHIQEKEIESMADDSKHLLSSKDVAFLQGCSGVTKAIHEQLTEKTVVLEKHDSNRQKLSDSVQRDLVVPRWVTVKETAQKRHDVKAAVGRQLTSQPATRRQESVSHQGDGAGKAGQSERDKAEVEPLETMEVDQGPRGVMGGATTTKNKQRGPETAEDKGKPSSPVIQLIDTVEKIKEAVEFIENIEKGSEENFISVACFPDKAQKFSTICISDVCKNIYIVDLLKYPDCLSEREPLFDLIENNRSIAKVLYSCVPTCKTLFEEYEICVAHVRLCDIQTMYEELARINSNLDLSVSGSLWSIAQQLSCSDDSVTSDERIDWGERPFTDDMVTVIKTTLMTLMKVYLTLQNDISCNKNWRRQMYEKVKAEIDDNAERALFQKRKAIKIAATKKDPNEQVSKNSTSKKKRSKKERKLKFTQTSDGLLRRTDEGAVLKAGDWSWRWWWWWRCRAVLPVGRYYWQLQITCSPGCVWDVGVVEEGCGLRQDINHSSESWYIRMEYSDDKVRCYSQSGGEIKPDYQQGRPHRGPHHLGLYLDCDQRSLTFLDCGHNRVMATVRGLRVTQPLVPWVHFCIRPSQSVSARLINAVSENHFL